MNFTYLEKFPEMERLCRFCTEAEELAVKYPAASAASARRAMEYIVRMIYAAEVAPCYQQTTFDMMSDARFVAYIGDKTLLNTLHYIRKIGNVAAHSGEISNKDSIKVLEELHFLVGEFCVLLGLVEDYEEFVDPQETTPVAKPIPEPAPIMQKESVNVEHEVIAKFAPRMRAVRFNVKHERDEEENKKLFLTASLREAGWPIVTRANQALPCAAGLNMILDDGDTVDYILYGRDNKPLAVIEYTVTTRNLIEGRRKAIEKADKLAEKLGYKPIVYYTNGYHVYVIDQLGYPPRRVFQFHSIEELELLKLRATMRQDISDPVIDDAITNREYQKKAIRATCNAFMQDRRHSLLVMATGTGKTRVSISLVDVLMKAGWVKNILFLADRTSLVRQAHKNFNKLLPNVTTSIYAGGSMNRDRNARVIFSTYQTMINLINDDTREFSIGRFDLIIIDEAHRSIFRKYGALFHYFDALMIGLTATPRSEDNKSTYQMFELRDGCPDFAYELEEAINDGFLVGFSVLDRTTEALRRGLHYDELSDEEKEKFEDTFATGDEDGSRVDYRGTVVDAKAMHRRDHINLGTIDVMLNDLMKNGIKISGGDKLGKTIIFASSHLEAEKIVERFQTLYAHLGMDFCKLIDCHIVNNLGIIDNFGERENLPQVAVSVDMMDTGIDVPDVVNLVFFKKVSSKIKFLQMIGRGTRLSKDLYGPSMDKQGFLVFDYYDNFNFFRTRNTWSTVNSATNGKAFMITPQSELINRSRLHILSALTQKDSLTPFEGSYRDSLKQFFVDAVGCLCNDDIDVQYNMSYISKYRTAEQWDGFTNAKIEEIEEKILPLLPAETSAVKVKAFDLLIYLIEENVPKRMLEGKDVRKIRHGYGNVYKKIDAMLAELVKLKTIPAIVAKEDLIKKMRNADLLFDNFSLELCEKVREELRELMRFIPDNKDYYVIDARDFLIDTASGEGFVREKSYADRVREYLASNEPVIAKIRNLDELTKEEKNELDTLFKAGLGSEADYIAWSGNQPLLPFLRVQVGISDEAIETKFGSFLNDTVLSEQQLAYMYQIIGYARENGDVVFLDLQRVSPFCDVDIMELFGDKLVHIKTLINGLHRPVV